MVSKGKNKHENRLSLFEAVETLSDIADLEILPHVGATEKHSIVFGKEAIIYRSIQWIHQEELENRLNHLKEIFKVVLGYLREFYKKQNKDFDTQHNINGIKSIMVLVGEAAKKLDRFTKLFNVKTKDYSITEWKEYKQLQDFYLSKIARHIDEGVLSKWIYALAQRRFMINSPASITLEKNLQTKHVFVDLEAVKKDDEYELFFIRKEDGSRFYSPRMLRNIKLVCDFGDYMGDTKADSPLNDLYIWKDRVANLAANSIYKDIEPVLRHYMEVKGKYKNQEFIESIQKVLMALMLACHSNHLIKNSPPKSCAEYFADFQMYLRETLTKREYQRLIAYAPDKEENVDYTILETIESLCASFFKAMNGYNEMVIPIKNLIKESLDAVSHEHIDVVNKSRFLWNRLTCINNSLSKLIKRHANGPLIKVINDLEENRINCFDPLMQDNLPSLVYHLYFNEEKVDCLHIPSPVIQESIDKVAIAEEFKAYIRSMKLQNTHKKLLLINFQDRTSWREYVRSKNLEDMQFQDEFEGYLTVISLPKDTEFYYQLPPYLNDKHAQEFIKQLKTQVFDEQSGFFFPKEIKDQLMNGFMDDVISAIHRIFFHQKNVLLPEHRMDFIELFYFFLELKLIEITKSSSFSFTCKDGVDVGSVNRAVMFVFLKLINEESLTESEKEYLDVIMYSVSLLVRERLVNKERFKRMLSVIKTFEGLREDHGYINFSMIMKEAFGKLYKTSILDSLVIIPK